MDQKTFLSISAQQKTYFLNGRTRDLSHRIEKLKELKHSIRRHEADIFDALKKDLGKPAFESYASEIGLLYDEVNHALKHLRAWARPQRVPTPIVHFPSTSYMQYEPKGVVLIIAAWNYPVQLILNPLFAAVAAGNCVVVKPSEFAPASALVVEKIIRAVFPPEHVAVAQGEGHEIVPMMMSFFRFDHILYTGSVGVARKIAAEAAKDLIPVTLELGGKSPCIVDASGDLKVAARRIVWGKFFNAGQTCISPDYVLADRRIKKEFTELLLKTIREMYGEDPGNEIDMSKIIDDRHFVRLEKLLSSGRILFGGKTDREKRFIQPTLMEVDGIKTPLMEEEIFGPILPVVGYDTADDAIDFVRQHPYPLSLYVFTKDRKFEKRILSELPFGNGAVNNTMIHYANPELPFGGIEYSGIGAYHGKSGFEAFSHRKSIIRSGTWLDIPIKYPPFAGKLKWLRLFQRP